MIGLASTPAFSCADIIVALHFCAALYWFWYIRGHIREGRIFLERALAHDGDVSDPVVKARALTASGEAAWTHFAFGTNS